MTTKNPRCIAPIEPRPAPDPVDTVPTEPLTDEERERLLEHYRSMDFKEFLAACPIDGIDLTREHEYPREVEL